MEVGLEVVGDDLGSMVVGAEVRLVAGGHCDLEQMHARSAGALCELP